MYARALVLLLTTLFAIFVSEGHSQSGKISVRGTTGEAAEYPPGKTFRDCIDCPLMLVIPAGGFEIGSPKSESGHAQEEEPQREVRVRRFAAGKFDVTRNEWRAFASATKRNVSLGCAWTARSKEKRDPKGSWVDLGFPQDDRHPVVCVTWKDAQDYVGWLSLRTHHEYRLLTEAEWEYAARAGTKTAYPWGPTGSHEYANYGAENWGGLTVGRDHWFYTSPVGSFPPNSFGLYDMHGNVLQWVEDCFANDYSDLPSDGTAYIAALPLKTSGDFAYMNATSSCSYRRLRGGDWGDPAWMVRSAARNWAPPPNWTLNDYRSAGVGFRVAMSLD
ncbi:MAG TPA: formylglycine-generating enzyme family protein [Candidatus Acidoferrum sp.]|jgi:formylglycine-generating enzyme required for sulfatase activity|nr:formylglycine-generating enzyme family protein [Candidatus Acidoferrum sp.]